MRARLAGRQAALALLAAAAVAVGVAVAESPGAASSRQELCAGTATRSADRAAVVTGAGARVSVIGDSYAQGLGLDHPGESWPARLPGRVRVDGFAGSGFSPAASPCAGEAYADRVPAALADHPRLVVLQGGLNDFDVSTTAVAAGADRALDALAGHRVLVIGPVSAPARAGQVSRVDRTLAAVADRHGVRYLRATGWQLSYLRDGLHLTPAGHTELGDRVASVVAGMLSPTDAPS